MPIMELNLPILSQLENCKNVLITGMGGGFDIFCGLPLYFSLRHRGINVHLANYSFSLLAGLNGGVKLNKGLVGVTHEVTAWLPYFPEHYLARWFYEKNSETVTIWCFEKSGVRPLLENYETLIEHLGIDAVLTVDGGVDSLMRGDESAVGTFLEDSVSLCAVNELKHLSVRLSACIGFGAELDLAHEQAFENIARLTELDAFLGSCSLTKQMEAYQLYEDAVIFVQNIQGQDPSVINSSIVSAVQGRFGDYHMTEKTRGSRLWISPLMPIYWFFDLRTIAKRNLSLDEIRWTDSFSDVVRIGLRWLSTNPKRKHTHIPLK